ncbi:MAG: hypothetical protein ACLPR9_06380 [Acidimicrobiales bacterium]
MGNSNEQVWGELRERGHYAGLRPEKTQAFLEATMNWVNTHNEQVIIVVSLALGFWLIGKSIYLIVA